MADADAAPRPSRALTLTSEFPAPVDADDSTLDDDSDEAVAPGEAATDAPSPPRITVQSPASDASTDSIVEHVATERDLPEPPTTRLPRSESNASGIFEAVSLDGSADVSLASDADTDTSVAEPPAAAVNRPLPMSPPPATNGTSSSHASDSPSRQSFQRPRARSGTLPHTADGRPPLLSGVLIVNSLEALASSKEARKSAAIRDASQKALDLLRSGAVDANTTRTVFEPLRLACETKSYPLMIAALDCIGKLVSHASQAATSGAPRSSTSSSRSSIDGVVGEGGALASDPVLADEIVSTVCNCFVDQPGSSIPTPSVGPSSAAAAASHGPDAVNLHILSALLALILSSALPVHQSSLLKAVRTVYNVFLLSRGQQNQMVAQAALGQIVGAVFGRVRLGGAVPTPRTPLSGQSSSVDLKTRTPSGLGFTRADDEDEPRGSGETIRTTTEAAPDTPGLEVEGAVDVEKTPRPDATPRPKQDVTDSAPSLRAMESRRSFDAVEDAPAENATPLSVDELHVKDAFLVFRALCKLSMKPLGAESERDAKSHAMRSKLLSLQLILTVLHLHMPLFVDPSVLIYSSSSRERTPFVHAVKQYLCLSISRNAVSSVIGVFELSCEIFWRVLQGMRTKLKKEIEVLLNEIFLPILEMRNSTARQKSILLGVMSRLCHDPQALVEIYLNYDCDRSSLDNVYERLMNIVSKMGTTQYGTTTLPPAPGSEPVFIGADGTPVFVTSAGTGTPTLPPASTMEPAPAYPANMPYEVRLKRQSLESLVSVLRSLVLWAGKGTGGGAGPTSVDLDPSASSSSLPRASEDGGGASLNVSVASSALERSPTDPVVTADDPSRFETAKQRKTTLLEGIKKFNFKPKRGIAFLTEHGFIRSNAPADVARFLLHADGLSKAMIGEWLGEGDEENIATMHAFVDFMDFAAMRFVDALRLFLQSFRLPGESQKIDRFMLKFAERYVAGNPTAFATADTAYVLSYSVIMLNTDLYNPQNKRRMTKAEFVKNNRGINEGEDLPETLLHDIYDEIATHEIRMKDEIELPAGPAAATGLAGALSSVGRDFQREAYTLQSEGMVSKTEALFRTMVRASKRGGGGSGGAASRTGNGATDTTFFAASHFEHVRPMFTVAWMAILAGISAPLQESDDPDVVALSLDGFKQAIKIVCLFDLELERNAFVTTLAKFTFLNNLSEMRPKNVEAIKALLGVAAIDGNYLKSSWRDVITCVSQLERFQLISQGVDARVVPEVGRKAGSSSSRSSASSRAAAAAASRPTDEVARETGSRHITIAADRVFSASNTLSGTAIVDFVRALSEVSWSEIQSSGMSDHPRTFCLQKLVEISYYNMDRIRLEWSQIWALMGEHFNQVCCHSNVKVSFFALDALRQMASHFLEKEELANFKFQKDFLRPFEYAMVHNANVDARDMILQCFRQLIQARVANLRSGWRTMFGVFSAASKVLNERIAVAAFDMVKDLDRRHFRSIVVHGAFADLAVCITDFCKISLYQKISLHAIEMLKGLIPQMLASPDCPVGEHAVTATSGDASDPYRWWFPVLFGFYDVIMNGEDLEVRKRALDYLFETLKAHGHSFSPEFWNQICKEVLFPIFAVLRSRADVTRFSTHEDMSVWLSTTMIQALRNLVDLFTFYFDVLSRMLDRLLDLLCECICQENDTLARIGTACLQQLLEKNVRKLGPELWERIVSTFITLFHTTTASQLFDPRLRQPYASTGDTPSEELSQPGAFVPPLPLSPGVAESQRTEAEAMAVGPPLPAHERKRAFRQIIVKCVLQLLLIETSHELLANELVYSTIPAGELLKLMRVLDESYRFAKRFNADKDLRMALWHVGFMKQLPNLLKQESSAAATLVSVLLRSYADTREDHVVKRPETVAAFLPLALDIVGGFVGLDAETQARNIAAWQQVVSSVLEGFAAFEDATLLENIPLIYPLAVDLLARDLAPEVRAALRTLLYRIGIVSSFIRDADVDEDGEGEGAIGGAVGAANGDDPAGADDAA